MSFYDDASLVFLPSGQAGKDGKAYSIKPTNGDGDFTFSRGSNLTATRIDSNGLIEKGRENLLLQSNSFDTTWLKTNASVTSGQSGYDGSSDAWLLSISAAGGFLFQLSNTSSINTFSVYAKAGTYSHLAFRIRNAEEGKFFNLSNGTIGSDYLSSPIDAKIEDVGNGWYRCSITTDDATNNCRIYPAQADGDFSGTSGNIYIQDAQLEQGLVATEYIESGASSGKAGLLEQEPRFDYSGGASCPSLLLEGSSTQLLEYSEYFEGSGWTIQSGVTLTTNTTETLSPEGLYNATKAVGDGTKGIFNNASSSGSHARSLYLKSVSGTINIRISDPYAGGLAQIKSVTTEWQRFDMIGDTGGSNCGIFIDDIPSSGVYIWGAMLEQGSYPTSYIPNHSGGSVTRDADITSVTSVSDLIGQTEGTIYCEFEYNGAADSGVFNRIIGLGTGVTQNRILLAKNDTTAELVAFAVSGGTTQVFQAIAGTSIIGHHKVAISYKANEYKVYLDGELEFTDSSASVPATTDVYVGTAEDGTTDNELGGVVKQSIIFKEVLSEDNCKALTTI